MIRGPLNCRLDLRAVIWLVNELANRHVARKSPRIALASRASPLNDQLRCGDATLLLSDLKALEWSPSAVPFSRLLWAVTVHEAGPVGGNRGVLTD